MKKELPKVSVVTITYGHGKYITETLNGVLMQDYPGEIEFIIANDHSPDDTDEVICKFFKEHPIPDNFEIKYTKNENNKGANPNFIRALKRATGKYIALCEGDDYWVHPMKLQKQVQLLENNPHVKISSHPSKRRYGEIVKADQYGYWGESLKIISPSEVISNYAGTAPFQSIMFRNEKVSDLCEILRQLLGAHSTIQIFYSLFGGLYYIPEYLSVYRFGSSSSISRTLFNNDKYYLKRQMTNWKNIDLLNAYSHFKFNQEFKMLKMDRAFSAIYSGYLTGVQKIFVLFKYKLYLEPAKSVGYLKSEIYLGLKKIKKAADRLKTKSA